LNGFIFLPEAQRDFPTFSEKIHFFTCPACGSFTSIAYFYVDVWPLDFSNLLRDPPGSAGKAAKV
jgi:hypothetical protein